MKYLSKVVEIEAEKITKVAEIGDNAYSVITDTDRVIGIVSSQKVVVGDYLNVTDPYDIYHMPAKIIDGPNNKYYPKE